VPLSSADAERLAGTRGVVRDAAGQVVGLVVSLLLDAETRQATWVTIERPHTPDNVFLPLDRAWVEGSDLVVGFPSDAVDVAPPVTDPHQISPAEERALRAHYFGSPDTAAASPLTVRRPRPGRRSGSGSGCGSGRASGCGSCATS